MTGRSVAFVVEGRAVPWKAADVLPVRTKDGGVRRIGRKPEATARWQDWVRLVASGHAPRPLLAGALQLSLVFHRHPSASWPAWKREAAVEGLVLPTVSPDSTNVCKAVEDACNGIIWTDDKQITSTIVTRRYCDPREPERVEVFVAEVGLGIDARREEVEGARRLRDAGHDAKRGEVEARGQAGALL